jgi:hypothetical protein
VGIVSKILINELLIRLRRETAKVQKLKKSERHGLCIFTKLIYKKGEGPKSWDNKKTDIPRGN